MSGEQAEQIRNWTYVSDIVEGTLQAAELADDGQAFNIGTMEGTRVLDAANLVLKEMGHAAAIRTMPEMPTGPYYRISDNQKLKAASGWEPTVSFLDGLKRTIDWYRSVNSVEDIEERLPSLLLER